MQVEDRGDAVRVTRTVLFGDCDPAGIAYTPKIVDYALIAIDEFWKVALQGEGWFQLNVDHDIGTAFVDLHSRFTAPITPRQPLVLDVRLAGRGRSSIRFAVRAETGGRPALAINATCVFIRRSQVAAIEPPDWIAKALERFL